MKKQLLVLTLLAATSLSSFAQGYFLFQAPKSKGFDLSTGAVVAGGTQDSFAFLWNSGPSSNSAVGPGTSSSVAGIPAGTWQQIMSDPNYTLARDVAQANGIAVVVGNGSSGWNYNGGLSFGAQGSPAAGTVWCYVIGWNNNGGTLTTPALAAAAGATLGYSSIFPYAVGASSGAPVVSFSSSGLPAFGIQAVPEPATFAMAGLGAAAMLIFRRRK